MRRIVTAPSNQPAPSPPCPTPPQGGMKEFGWERTKMASAESILVWWLNSYVSDCRILLYKHIPEHVNVNMQIIQTRQKNHCEIKFSFHRCHDVVHVQTVTVEVHNLNKPNIKNTCQMMSTEVSWQSATRTANKQRKPRRSREDKRIANRNRERESVIITSVCAPS